MGVVILALNPEAVLTLRIGGTRHSVGMLAKLWKVTETNLVPERTERLDALDDTAAETTPEAVIIPESATWFAPPGPATAHRVLGWDLGRRRTQDLDYDHLPTLGFGVEDADGEYVLHEAVGNLLVPMTEQRAQALGILSGDGRLLRRGQPTIIACSSVESMPGGYYAAQCELSGGLKALVLGESESGQLPQPDWLVGKTPDVAANYRLAHQVAMGR